MVEPVAPHLFLVLGGKGDLMHRKLLPALYQLHLEGYLPEGFRILGAGRSQVDDDTYQRWALSALLEAGFSPDEQLTRWCEETLHYQSTAGEDGYQYLAARVNALEEEAGLPGNRVLYLAMPPAAFPGAIEGLGEAGLNQSGGWVRLVVEKPFGRDLASAQALNSLVHRYFAEDQVYRIDHYLGKETVQNLLVFRFANALFEPIWNRDRVDRVEIVVAESIGVEGRAGYFDEVGTLRDMIQNHLTQLLCLTAMEVPAVFEAEAIRDEKVKVLRTIAPIRPSDVVFGQYTRGTIGGKLVPGYREGTGVPPDSQTETFAAVRLEVSNWRWQGVPFILYTGKALPRRVSQIVVTFRQTPSLLFQPHHPAPYGPNRLVITIQPDEGFDLCFEVKGPGEPFRLEQHSLRFRYADFHGPLPEAYETLLLDIMNGDATLFVRADEVEAAWRLYTPLLENRPPVHFYAAGTWGPSEAARMLGAEVQPWRAC